VLEDASEPVWVDRIHTDEDGTARVAEALWSHVAVALDERGEPS
jgi:hypothetical protein